MRTPTTPGASAGLFASASPHRAAGMNAPPAEPFIFYSGIPCNGRANAHGRTTHHLGALATLGVSPMPPAEPFIGEHLFTLLVPAAEAFAEALGAQPTAQQPSRPHGLGSQRPRVRYLRVVGSYTPVGADPFRVGSARADLAGLAGACARVRSRALACARL